MRTMKRNARTLTAILALVTGAATITMAAPADDRLWATRVKCEVQTAGGTSLQDLTWQQGTTPLLSLDQYRLGKSVDATNTVTAIVRFGPSATNQTYFVSVTNYATSGNGYLVQMPTVGTNTAGIAAGWWYTAYFEIAGKRYWTGNGRLDIEATTSTADGLVWQEITCGAQTNVAHNSLLGIEGAGTLHVTAADTNRLANALTNVPTLQQVVTAGGTVTSGTVTIDTLSATAIKAITSAGGGLQSFNGTPCLTWGAGGGCNVSTTDGLMVSGVITGNGSGITNMTAAQVGALSTNGGTVTGSILTTVDQLTASPASDELVTAEWVRSLALQGQSWYWTAAVTNGFGQKTTNFVALSLVPDGAVTTSIPSPVSSSTYLAGGIATQLFGSVRSPITFEIWCSRVAGNSSSIINAHPEIYYVYAGTTNHLGDWEAGDQNVAVSTLPTKYTWTVSFPEPTITGGVHIIGYLKSGTVSGTAAGLKIYGGGVYDSHMSISAVPAGESAADVAADLVAHEAETIAGGAHGGLTPAGIAAAGGIVTNSIPGPGCTYLGTSQAVTLTGATTSYRAEPAGVYTVSVSQAASRYTYALEVISTNPCTLAAGLNLQGSWTITGTNILAIVPCTGTLWRVYGRGL